MDMEWNQVLTFSEMVKDPVFLTGEIIQIGAIKLNQTLEVVDSFNERIAPQYGESHLSLAHGMPSRGLNHADGTSRLCWHQILSNTCACGAATSKCVEIAVVLIGLIRQLTLGEIRSISIYRNIAESSVTSASKSTVVWASRSKSTSPSSKPASTLLWSR